MNHTHKTFWYSFAFILSTAFGTALPLIPAYASTPMACPSFSTNLHQGLSGDDVTALQSFLATKGYFTLTPTGYFGPITYGAVQRYQRESGISATGYVGVLTRGAISSECYTPPANTISLRALSPSAAPVGATVSITGFGFTSNNTILLDGSLVARNVPITSSIAVTCTTDPSCVPGIRQTLTFVVPSAVGPNCAPGMMCAMYMRLITPGVYTVSVQNSNGTSNTLPFTVTGSNTEPLSITGLDAPATLALGVPGTWNVHVSAPGTSGQLHYSVIWGDETYANGNTAIMAPSSTEPAQTSSSFTHAYHRSGTYTLIFTVADDNGNSVSTSNTLTVTPLY